MPPPEDSMSGMCAQGKHGRCTGWMVVPNMSWTRRYPPDISVKCRCPVCDHPDVHPHRHLNEP